MATKAAKSITINATKYELANALAKNDGKIQLLAKDVVLGEVEIPSGGNALAMNNDKIQLLDNDVVLSEVELPSGGDALFFRHVHDEDNDTWSVEVKNGKGERFYFYNRSDAYDIIEKGGRVYAVYPMGVGSSYIYHAMDRSFGDDSGFVLYFDGRSSENSFAPTQIKITWYGTNPIWEETEYKASFTIHKFGVSSLSDLAVGDAVSYSGHQDPMYSIDLATIILHITLTNGIECQCISRTHGEYGEGTNGMTFLASNNSEKYLIGLKYQNNAWTIGSLKAL